ncbi:MAG TPA: polyamine aminopropyltransferase [Limnochordia bacterium]
MELWFTEKQTPTMTLGLKVRRTVHEERTAYQHLAIVDTEGFGRVLVLDGAIQLTERHEFSYHEMIAHVPLCAHPEPRCVAVIGGGDGGAVREILKHPSVERVVHVEIDPAVVDAARRFLPEVSAALADPRVEFRFEDGLKHIAACRESYDVIVIDSTDPVGPAAGLFREEFYMDVAKALRPGGLAVAQTESPYVNADLIRAVWKRMRPHFSSTRLYLAAVPMYPTGLWSFTVGSLGPDPAIPHHAPQGPVRYYTPEVHRAAFVLPPFVAELLAPAPTGDGSA